MTDRRLLSLTIIAVLAGAQASAQGTPVPLRQMDHRAWFGEAGPPRPGAHTVRRSSDGYLWLSAVDALIRFDGVRFTVFDSSVSPAFRSAVSGPYVVGPVDADDALQYVRQDRAVVKYLNGRFELVPAPVGPKVGPQIEIDGAGREWLWGGRSRTYIRDRGRIAPARLPPGVPDSAIAGLVPDLGKGMWIGTTTRGLWHVVGDSGKPMSKLDAKPRANVRPLLQARDGTLWASGTGLSGMFGLHRLVRGRWLPIIPPGQRIATNARVAVEDSSHAIWIGTVGHGLLRWRNGEIEQFTRKDGLSDVSVDDVFLDVGGSVWVTTSSGGLDLLRPTEMHTVEASDGLPFPAPYRTAQDSLGVIWSSGVGTGIVTELRGGALEGRAGPIRSRLATLPSDTRYDILGGARDGGVWLAPFTGGLIRYRHDRVDRWTSSASELSGKRVRSAQETQDGGIWVSVYPSGIGVLRGGRYRAIAIADPPDAFFNRVVLSGTNRVWAAVLDQPYLLELNERGVVRKLGPEDGIPAPISNLILEGGDTLWGSTQEGLTRLIGNRLARVHSSSLAVLLNPQTQIGISGGFLWLVSDEKAGRIPLAALHAAADDRTVILPPPRLFGAFDGLPTPQLMALALDPVITTREGRLLISTPAGIGVFDPSHRVPPPVPARPHIEEISVGGRVIADTAPIRIPPNPDRVSFRYTVTNLLAGDRTRIAYRLDPIDTAWIDGGLPRIATYTQLRPGDYRFRVRGLDDLVNAAPAEATLAFEVVPAWYQTVWSRVLGLLIIAATAASVTVAVQRRRSHMAAQRLHLKFQGMLTERTRIARELHDTLLQGFTGIVLHLEALRRSPRESPQAQDDELSRILTIADSTLFDARQSVWDMRTGLSDDTPLAEQVQTACNALGEGSSVAVRFVSTDEPLVLTPDATATVLHICREAVRNALQHANPRTVEVALRREAGALTLTVADNGKGMAEHLNAPPGHFGIVGMRERAARVAGVLSISSAPNAGTSVELTIPVEGNR